MFQVGQAIAIFLCLIILVVLGLTIGKFWIKELFKRCKRKKREVTPTPPTTTKIVEEEEGAMEGRDSPITGEF